MYLSDSQLERLNTMWVKFEVYLNRIFKSESPTQLTGKEYMEIYTFVFQYCSIYSSDGDTHPQAPGRHLNSKLDQYLRNNLRNLLHELESITDDEMLLRSYLKYFKSYETSSALLNQLCYYMNKNWLIHEEQEVNIYRMAMITFKKTMDELSGPLINGVNSLIEAELNGELIDRHLVYEIMESYVKLYVLDTNQKVAVAKKMDNVFGSQGVKFYKEHSKKEFKYLLTNEKFKELQSRLPYLFVQWPQHINELYTIIKEDFFQIYLEKIFNGVDEKYLNECKSFFKCFAQQCLLLIELELENLLKQNIYSEFKNCISYDITKKCQIFANSVLDILQRNQKIMETLFSTLPRFKHVADKACRQFLDDDKSPKLVAQCLEQLLKNPTNNLDKYIDRIVHLLGYVNQQEIFRKHYTSMLMHYLVNKSLFEDTTAVQLLIKKITTKKGEGFSEKHQKWLDDFNVAKEFNEKFQRTKLDFGFKYQVKMLSSGSWPLDSGPNFRLPTELQPCVDEFELFYLHAKQHRRIIKAWIYSMSRGELTMNLNQQGPHTLQATTFQMAVLLQFNDQLSYTVQQLMENTQTQLEDLIKVLKDLLESNLLTSDDSTNSLSSTSTVMLCLNYTNKKHFIDIAPSFCVEDSLMANAETNEEKHKYILESAIITIMKKKKTLKQEELFKEVKTYTSKRFMPTRELFKKCLDNLIDKDFLERSNESIDTLRYMP